jgi:hypothetical protein
MCSRNRLRVRDDPISTSHARSTLRPRLSTLLNYTCSGATILSTLPILSYFLYIGIAQYKAPFKRAAVIGPAQWM